MTSEPAVGAGFMQPEETETDSTLRAELQSDSRREPSTKEARKPAAKKEAATEGPQIPVTAFIINDLRVRSVPGLLTLTHRFPGRGKKTSPSCNQVTDELLSMYFILIFLIAPEAQKSLDLRGASG